MWSDFQGKVPVGSNRGCLRFADGRVQTFHATRSGFLQPLLVIARLIGLVLPRHLLLYLVDRLNQGWRRLLGVANVVSQLSPESRDVTALKLYIMSLLLQVTQHYGDDSGINRTLCGLGNP